MSRIKIFGKVIENKSFYFRNLNFELLFLGLKISNGNWNTIKQISEALKPVSILTTKLQEEKLSIPDLVGHWKFALHQLKEIKSEVSENLHKSILLREPSVLQNRMIKLGTFLDLKCKRLLNEIEISEAKRYLLTLYTKYLEITGVNSQTEEAIGESSPPEEMSDFDLFFGSFQSLEEPIASSQHGSELNDELNKYEKLSWEPKCKLSSVEFWLSKSQELPSLSRIALEIMAVPATEVSVERLFSHLKIVFTDKRSRIDPALLEAILLLRLNKKFNSGG